jgi:hypothetical protein
MTAGRKGSDSRKFGSIWATAGECQANSDTQSLEERNERQVLEYPDKITQEAHIGVQKAEATALVWSRTALYATYAW